MEIQLSSDARYEKIWHLYLSEFELQPDLRLTSYLRSRQINRCTFATWMLRHGHSVREARSLVLRMETDAGGYGLSTAGTFLPVLLDGQDGTCARDRAVAHDCDQLTGVSLTLPGGTVVSIRRGSAEAVVSFIRLYTGEDVPCSD